MVTTTYDEHREHVRNMMKEVLKYVRSHMLDPDVWGFDDMVDDYPADLYAALMEAYTTI